MFDSSMIACVLIPRHSLTSALGNRREMIGRPLALSPEPGGPQVIGEVSGAAETFGVRAGMRLAEALGRCPALVLVAPDPVRAEAHWEGMMRRLEGLGAAIEPGRPGEAFFTVEQLRALYGSPEMILAKARRALGTPVRVGAGPNRMCAFAAARRMRARRPAMIVEERAARRFVAGLPVAMLGDGLAWARRSRGDDRASEREAQEVSCVDALERLGVRTLGELAALPAEAVADRFGKPGLRALRLARGAEEPLRPRQPHEDLLERLALPEAVSGPQLERAMRLLIERLLAHPGRAGRTLRRLRIEAGLAGGGGWRTDVVLRSASADAERLRLALVPKLDKLPGPTASLGLRAVELGPEAGEQPALSPAPEDERRGRVTEAVGQARAAAGRDAVLRLLEVDPASRVPERRATLSPWSSHE
jgi:protein ImuB